MFSVEHIRSLTEDQKMECISVARALSEYFDSAALEEMRQDLPHGLMLLATDDRAIIGFACLDLKSSKAAEIKWMAVDRTRQRQGVGSAILESAARYLASQGFSLLEVKTLAPTVEYEPYQHTRRFYEKHEFILLDIIDPFPGWAKGNPCALYVRILDANDLPREPEGRWGCTLGY